MEFSTSVYEVTESAGYVNVQVVKSGFNDIAVSVLFSTIAGSALGTYIHCTGRRMSSNIESGFYVPQLLMTM